MSNHKKLKTLLSDCFSIPLDQVKDDLTKDDVPSWDSLATVNLVSELESEFDVNFDVSDIVMLRTYQIIVESLKSKGVDFDTGNN